MDAMGPSGETVLDYSVYDAIRAGFTKVVFIIRKDFAEAFEKGIGARFSNKIQVEYAYQALDDLPAGFTVPEGRTKPWGTAHAILAARNIIKESFAVINADDFYGADSYQRAADFLKKNQNGDHYAMVGYAIENTLSDHGDVNRGICVRDQEGFLTNVEEVVKIARNADTKIIEGIRLDGSTMSIAEGTPVSMNFWAFTASYISHLQNHFQEFLTKHGKEEKSECYIPTVVDALIHAKQADCKVLETTSTWFGVTYPEDKPHVVENIRKLIAAGQYPEKI